MQNLKSARIGTTLFIYDSASELRVKKEIKAGGHGATFRDGSQEWIEDVALVDTSKTGSEQYQWDKTGNMVKHERVRVTIAADGTMQRTVEKTIFKAFGV